MKIITATELARNLRQVLDRLQIDQDEIVVERNHQPVARILPGPGKQTALEAMADLYRTLSQDAATNWEEESRQAIETGTVEKEIQDPWAS